RRDSKCQLGGRVGAPGSRALPLLLNHVGIRVIGVIRVIPGKVSLRRKRRDNFFEARLAAERIPHRTQTQFAVGWTKWDFREDLELLDGQFAFTSQGVN